MVTRRPSIGALLRMPAQAVRVRLHASLIAAGFDDLHPAHLNVFQFPGPDGAQPSVLAERALMSRQAMNHVLGELERLGYLTREAASADRRARVVRLTDRGLAAQAVVRATLGTVERDWRALLGERTYVALREGLATLNERLDDSARARAPHRTDEG